MLIQNTIISSDNANPSVPVLWTHLRQWGTLCRVACPCQSKVTLTSEISSFSFNLPSLYSKPSLFAQFSSHTYTHSHSNSPQIPQFFSQVSPITLIIPYFHKTFPQFYCISSIHYSLSPAKTPTCIVEVKSSRKRKLALWLLLYTIQG